MENEKTRKELLDSLVDIRDVRIDRSMSVEDRMKSYVEQIKNPYMFKVGNTVVRVSYANTQATINAVERVLVYDTETIEIVWKFNESKIDTDENIGVAN